jgi:hypothetical protein
MYIPEYNTGIANNLVSNLAIIIPKYNESISPTYDYLYDSTDHNMSYSGGSQDLEIMLQQFFSKMSDNQTTYDLPSGSSLRKESSSSLPSSSNDANSYHLLSIISLWFVLLINPIVVKKK